MKVVRRVFFLLVCKKMAYSTPICQWTIDDVTSTTRGSKIAKIRCGEGICVYTPTNAARIPFEPGTFDKDPCAMRLNLVMECDSELQNSIDTFDAWIVDYLTRHSQRIFKKEMTPEQVAAGYSSCVKHPPFGKNYGPTLKTKIDLGKNGIRCWNVDSNDGPVAVPHTWKNLKLKPRLHFSHLWIMGQQYGAVLKVLDAEILGYDDSSGGTAVTNPFK